MMKRPCAAWCQDMHKPTLADRFWAKVDKRDGGCWLWTACTHWRWGYGHIRGRGKTLPAHRVSWELHNGPIPDGQVVCHACDTPACVNPGHLFLGTQADNCADRNRKGRQSRGHDRPGSRFEAEQVLAIRASNKSNKELAAEYGVTYNSIWAIKTKLYWKHL